MQQVWSYAPTYDSGLTWSAARSAAVRCAVCGVLLYAMLTPHRLRPHIDLYPSYVAAHFANEGRWDRIYHATIWLHDGVDPEWDKRATELTRDQLHGTSFVYHPWYLQVMRPIAALTSYSQFQQGTVFFNQFCIVITGLAIAILLGATNLPMQLLATLLVGKATTTIYGLEFGQNVMPALMFTLAAALAWRSRAPLWLGGVLTALAWICKPWCSLVLLLCFALRGVKAGLITSVALAFAMILLPDLVMPDQLMRDYKAMTLALTNVSVSGYNNFSILVTLERLFQPDWGRHVLEWLPRAPDPTYRVAALGSAALVFVLGFGLWWWRRPALRYTIGAVLAALLLPLGITWTHYFVFAIPLACVCTFDPKAPLALRVVGIALLAELIGLAEFAGIPNDRFGAFFSNPPRYPWRQALPIILVVVGVLAALALAPREEREGPDAC